MIIGTGVDIIEIERIAKAAKNERFFDKIFSDSETALFEASKYRMETVAGRFAAKEAVMKALGCGLGDMPMKSIEVLRAPSGQPVVELKNEAKQKAEALGVKHMHISISHSERYAVAQAVAEGDAK
jgi:phosphopantetheine--protein transferase-like protein